MSATTFTKSNDTLLRRALQADFVVSGTTGILMLVAPQLLISITGDQTIAPHLAGLGLFMVAYAAFLIWLSTRDEINRTLTLVVIIGNALWAAGSFILIAVDPIGMMTASKWLIAISADIVAVLAIAQFIGLRRMN